MNPFVYHRPVAPDQVIGRERDAARLLEAVATGVNATLYAPRRFGKTSLIAKVLDHADREHGMAAVTVDCYGVLTREDFAARVARAYQALPGRLGRRVGQLVESITAGLQIAGTGANVGVQRRDAAAEGLLIDLLDLPLRTLERTGLRSVVAFDEFQAIIDVPGLDGLLRSRIQYHGEAAAYVFAGSEPTLLGALFNDRSRPLYGQAVPLRLGRLPAQETLPAIAQKSMDALVSRGMLERGDGGLQIVDPLLALWVAELRAP
jgi:AAA+ ATPase superfamily predicted ATPase